MPPNDNRDNNDITNEPLVTSIPDTIYRDEKSSGRLPLWKKVAYGLGGPPMQMTSNTIAFFITIYLLETAVVNPFYNSVIVFGGRVWDAITDPIVGYLVQRTDTRWGKQRPWILFSTPFAVFGFFMFWYVPDIDSMVLRFVYFLSAYFVYQAAVTAYHVPYSSMTVVLSDNQQDRDTATAFRMGFEVLGVLMGNMIVGILITGNRDPSCGAPSMNSTNATNYNITTKTKAQFDKEKNAYMTGAGIICLLFITCALIVFFSIREKRGVVPEVREPFLRSLKSILVFKPYWSLMLSFLFTSLGMQILQGNLTLYASYSLNRSDIMGYAIIVLLVAAICSMPILQLIINRFGKKIVFVVCQLLLVPILITAYFLPRDVSTPVVYIIMGLTGVSVANAFLLPWSMLPDVIDAYMLEFGARREATFYSFYVFFNKFASGISLGLSQIVLGLIGYVQKSCTQPDSVGDGIRYLFTPGPLICVFISIVFIYIYPINENERSRVRRELEKVKPKMNNTIEKSDRLGSCISSSATLPSLMHSVDDMGTNSRTVLTSAMANGNTRV